TRFFTVSEYRSDSETPQSGGKIGRVLGPVPMYGVEWPYINYTPPKCHEVETPRPCDYPGDQRLKRRVVKLGDECSMALVWVPPGEFIMGSTLEEAHDDFLGIMSPEIKRTLVRITKGFWMGESPITKLQWREVMGGPPNHYTGRYLPNEAMEYVSWNDIAKRSKTRALSVVRRENKQYYLEILNERFGDDARLSFALPTEAQWEYACRAGTYTAYSFGDSEADIDKYAKTNNGTSGDNYDVMYRRPNRWGLYDMHGLVAEWTSSWFSGEEYPGGSVCDFDGPPSGKLKAVRGGSSASSPLMCRSAYRSGEKPDTRMGGLGFRVIATDI
ncbi:MAG: formylglycine-generating enzyme family protein, partial [Candidatus Sumerlaeia bacterium]|nr:formylglycine-generating enzyme family protein [Candidatus Sumerlaeia bacterium]